MNPENTPREDATGTGIVASRKKILQAMLVALIVAFIILIGAVLPAEYGRDPLRIGRAIGLTELYQKSKASVAGRTNMPHSAKYGEHVAEITLMPGQGQEYKFQIEASDSLLYSWSASGELFYDFHGEPKGARNDYFESYEKTKAHQAHGSLIAPFTGTHGWFWKNQSGEPVSITLRTAGYYEVVGNPKNEGK